MTKKSIQTKEQIIKSAAKCFRQYGYSKSTFGDIAKEAGISRALIYSYFKNKSDLFIMITKNLHDRFQAMSQEILKADGADHEKLAKIIDIWIVNPYRGMRNNNHGGEILDGLVNISEQSEKRFRKLFIKSIEPIVGEEVAEIIVFSMRGLMDDRPPVKTLQKRILLLIKNVV
jgi:AcrR family transcriptional regulator